VDGLCHNCQQPGHVIKDCPEPKPDTRKCRNCEEVGHVKAICPKVQCFKCKEMGHMMPNCTNKRVKACRNCGEVGHLQNSCPNPTLLCDLCGRVGHAKSDCRHGGQKKGSSKRGRHALNDMRKDWGTFKDNPISDNCFAHMVQQLTFGIINGEAWSEQEFSVPSVHDQKVQQLVKDAVDWETAGEDGRTAGGNWGCAEENAAEGDSGSAGESAAEECAAEQNSAEWQGSQEDSDEADPDEEFDG
jgi:hypothetical protein